MDFVRKYSLRFYYLLIITQVKNFDKINLMNETNNKQNRNSYAERILASSSELYMQKIKNY